MLACIKEKKPDVIRERKYKFDGVITIGQVDGFDNDEVHDDLLDSYMERILTDEHPHVIILGFC